MRSYKNVRIAKYKMKGIDSIVSIPLVEFQTLVENDSQLDWYEDVSSFYREIQEERGDEGVFKVCAVYKYKDDIKDPDFQATYIPITDDILIRIMNDYEGSIKKLKEIAEKLNANLYL